SRYSSAPKNHENDIRRGSGRLKSRGPLEGTRVLTAFDACARLIRNFDGVTCEKISPAAFPAGPLAAPSLQSVEQWTKMFRVRPAMPSLPVPLPIVRLLDTPWPFSCRWLLSRFRRASPKPYGKYGSR